MHPDAYPAVAKFARRVLGCQCAPEVFDSIALKEDAGLACVRVVIGARLLIYFAVAAAPARVATLASAGIRERDARGYNRFRLVLDQAGPDAGAQFRAVIGEDAKAHLHLVPEAEWPAAIRCLL